MYLLISRHLLLAGKDIQTLVLTVCDLDMCLTFTWHGWEYVAYDSRIFMKVLQKSELQFPLPHAG